MRKVPNARMTLTDDKNSAKVKNKPLPRKVTKGTITQVEPLTTCAVNPQRSLCKLAPVCNL